MARTNTYDHFCPVARSLEVIGEKWSLLVVRELLNGPRRFTGLERGLPRITPKWLTARLRELEEEIGTANAEIVAEAAGWLAYDLPPELAARIWGGRFRGQAQKWYAARFLGRDAEIDLGRHAHPEFSAWRWSPIDALPALIIGFKRPLYTRLVAELGPKVKEATRGG